MTRRSQIRTNVIERHTNHQISAFPGEGVLLTNGQADRYALSIIAFAGCTAPAVAHRREKGLAFRYGGRTKEATGASRTSNELARIVRNID